MAVAAIPSNKPKSRKAARISHDPVARISHDQAAGLDKSVTHAGSAAAAIAARLVEFALRSVSPKTRLFMMRFGIAGLLASGLTQGATAVAPFAMKSLSNPVAEVVGLHQQYAVVTDEPAEAAPGQGELTKRTKFLYDLRVTGLDTVGSVTGRFRGSSWESDGPTDPRWWLVHGNSDGKQARLTYTNEKGEILGHISLKRSKDGSTWAGELAGIDRSISDVNPIISPIIVAQSRYDIERLKNDDHLNRPSTMAIAYSK